MTAPTRIRAAQQGDSTEVRILMSHAMETGLRKDAAGITVPAHFITEVTVAHQGRSVLAAQFGMAVARNPYLQFKFKGGAKGDKLTVSWVDNHGDSRSDETLIA